MRGNAKDYSNLEKVYCYKYDSIEKKIYSKTYIVQNKITASTRILRLSDERTGKISELTIGKIGSYRIEASSMYLYSDVECTNKYLIKFFNKIISSRIDNLQKKLDGYVLMRDNLRYIK